MAVLTKITSRSLADNAVSSAKIQAGAIAVADVADGSISTAKLADDAVTGIKLENNPDWGGHNTIATTTVTQTNQWVEVTLNFSTNDILLNKFGIFFSGENNAIGNTYYIDDVTAPNLYNENQLRYLPQYLIHENLKCLHLKSIKDL